MPQYLYQVAYTSESLAAQIKNPQDRLESVGKQITDAVGRPDTGRRLLVWGVRRLGDRRRLRRRHDGRGRPRYRCGRGGPGRQDHASAKRRSVGSGPEEGAGGQRPVPPRPVGTTTPRRRWESGGHAGISPFSWRVA